MCDGLADDVLSLLKQMVEQSRCLAQGCEARIVVYVDGYKTKKQRSAWWKNAIRAFNKVFELRHEEQVKILDWDNEKPSAMALLRHCNIFHMAGGNAWNLVRDWQRHPCHLQILKERVQCGEVLYIGSSGGSISSGLNMQYCRDPCDGLGDMGDVAMKGLGIVDPIQGPSALRGRRMNEWLSKIPPEPWGL